MIGLRKRQIEVEGNAWLSGAIREGFIEEVTFKTRQEEKEPARWRAERVSRPREGTQQGPGPGARADSGVLVASGGSEPERDSRH